MVVVIGWGGVDHSRLIPMYNAHFILWPSSVSSPIRNMGRERRWPRWIKKASHIGSKRLWGGGMGIKSGYGRGVGGGGDNLLLTYTFQAAILCCTSGSKMSSRPDICLLCERSLDIDDTVTVREKGQRASTGPALNVESTSELNLGLQFIRHVR